MLVVRCAAIEFSSFVLSILLSGGADGMTDAGGVTDAVLFFINCFFVLY